VDGTGHAIEQLAQESLPKTEASQGVRASKFGYNLDGVLLYGLIETESNCPTHLVALGMQAFAQGTKLSQKCLSDLAILRAQPKKPRPGIILPK
jgi:hypothetical protein